MNLAGVFRLAIGRILVNKTRSALTMLGVIIGVASLVALISIAQGATSGINSSLQNLGGDKVSVSSIGSTSLTDSDAAAVRALDHVAAVSYQVSGSGTVTSGADSATVTVAGVSTDYAAVANPTIGAGSFLPDTDATDRTRAVVLGATAATALGLTGDDVGQQVTLEGRSFTVVGILSDSTGFAGRGGGTVYIQLATARTMFAVAPYLSSITVVADDADDVDGVVTEVTDTLTTRHHVVDSSDADFSVLNQASIVATLGSITTILQLLLGGIASISLLVGGIGIMNIMLVSVRERTKEIGIRRAIGAKRRTILVQFLVEATVLSLIGGLIGLVLGLAATYAVSLVGGWAFSVQGWVVALAVGFSALVGIVFGAAPARSAARMLPVDALRYE